MNELSNPKLILIGFMGTGKSIVSEQLALQLSLPRMDMDDEIIAQQKRSIPSIFASEGEVFFRNIETDVLKRLLQHNNSAVIATGGGAVLRASNRDDMLNNGFVVALQANPETIIARVSSDETRPLLEGDVVNKVYTLLEDRKHAYDFAHMTIDTTNLEVSEIVNMVMHEWELYLTTYRIKE